MASRSATEDWAWWPQERQAVKIVSQRDLWGQTVCEVLLSATGRVLPVARDSLASLATRTWTPDEVQWRVAAARALHIAASGQHYVLGFAAIDSLPHQLATLNRAMNMRPVRLLLADEVGLGKTIEAGLIWSELKARDLVRRVLVVAPKGVQLQWVAEMQNRFGETLVRVGPEGMPLDAGVDPWKAFDQVICSIDAVKPLRQRAGWSPEKVTEYNERRYQALADAGWDLVIFDEAHHVAGSTEDVSRHRLARRLSEVSPHVLLLSATPHSGKTEAFRRLLSLLDSSFLHGRELTKDEIAPLVTRAEKRTVVDSTGQPLFQPRVTSLEVIPYGDRRAERALYDAVTDYVRHGYNRALRERRPAIGFLVLLMQRLVSSSTAAIRSALERRLAAVIEVGSQLRLFTEKADEWMELTGEEQLSAVIEAEGEAWRDERAEVELLIDLARRSIADGADAKASWLLDLFRRVQRQEGNPSVKVVVFTEFIATQKMLLDLFERAAIPAVSINGGMGLEERSLAQDAFHTSAQVLVSTDAGGEGINLQFAHVVINYDLPWNPMRIEQRIGRVDRIGQDKPVAAYNFVLENSIDRRVMEVLEEKLRRIFQELGADKWGDVLAGAGSEVEDLYAEAILNPENLDEQASSLVDSVRADAAAAKGLQELLTGLGSQSPEENRLSELPAVLHIAHQAYERWISTRVEDRLGALRHLPEMAPGEPVPRIMGAQPGWWALWEVRVDESMEERDCFALFLADTDAVRPDIAQLVWDMLISGSSMETGDAPEPAMWDRLQSMGEDYAYVGFEAIKAKGKGIVPWVGLRLLVRVTT